MVKDVFNKRALMNLIGSMGIGHGKKCEIIYISNDNTY